jgi:hypothetical protein
MRILFILILITGCASTDVNLKRFNEDCVELSKSATAGDVRLWSKTGEESRCIWPSQAYIL